MGSVRGTSSRRRSTRTRRGMLHGGEAAPRFVAVPVWITRTQGWSSAFGPSPRTTKRSPRGSDNSRATKSDFPPSPTAPTLCSARAIDMIYGEGSDGRRGERHPGRHECQRRKSRYSTKMHIFTDLLALRHPVGRLRIAPPAVGARRRSSGVKRRPASDHRDSILKRFARSADDSTRSRPEAKGENFERELEGSTTVVRMPGGAKGPGSPPPPPPRQVFLAARTRFGCVMRAIPVRRSSTSTPRIPPA